MPLIERQACYDCGTLEGALHELGCESERCSRCGGQLISCGHFRKNIAKQKRIPFVHWPHMCARCSRPWPDFYMVSDEEWTFYIEPGKRDSIICADCFETIRAWTNEASGLQLPKQQTDIQQALEKMRQRHAALFGE